MRAHTLLCRLTATTIISGHFNSTAKKIRLKQTPNLVQYFKFMSTNLLSMFTTQLKAAGHQPKGLMSYMNCLLKKMVTGISEKEMKTWVLVYLAKQCMACNVRWQTPFRICNQKRVSAKEKNQSDR